jgi:hypothetical protein
MFAAIGRIVPHDATARIVTLEKDYGVRWGGMCKPGE